MEEKNECVNKELLTDSSLDLKESRITCLCSQRWVIGYLGFAFGVVISLYRIDMSMAVVCMVKDDVTSDIIQATVSNYTAANNYTYNVTNALTLTQNMTEGKLTAGCEGEIVDQKRNTNGEFDWDKKTQSIVLSAFFYGFVTTQIPAGWIIVKFGGKNVITTTITLSSICVVSIPVLARFHVIGVIVARILTGAALGPLPPAWFALLGRWALPNERSRMMMMFWIGQTVGAVAGIGTSGLLCVHGFDNGWGSIFYLHGIVGGIFVIGWVYFAADSPNEHPRISIREKRLIAKHLKTSTTTSEKITKVPWVKIFTSVPVWAIFLTELCDNWSYYLMLTCLPMFVNEVLKFDIQSNGFYSALPFIATLISLFCSGVLGDYVIKRGWVSRSCNRKLFQITALVGSSGFLVLSCYLPCDQRQMVILCISMCSFFLYLAYGCGYPCNLVDMTPRYASFLYGISNTMGSSTGFLAPLAVGFLTKNKTIEEWRLVFWISAGIACIGAVIYGLFSSSDLVDWDNAYTLTVEIEPPDRKPGIGNKPQGQTSIEMNEKEKNTSRTFDK